MIGRPTKRLRTSPERNARVTKRSEVAVGRIAVEPKMVHEYVVVLKPWALMPGNGVRGLPSDAFRLKWGIPYIRSSFGKVDRCG